MISKRLSKDYYQQKSRNKWLNEGDCNTKHFYNCAKTRKAKNLLISIQDDQGVEHINEEKISAIAITYFQDLFTTSHSANLDIFFDNFSTLVTPANNDQLTKPVSNEEILRAALDINGDKAPYPDGMTGYFYHQFWDTIGDTIINEVKDFFHSKIMVPKLDETHICLIPKIDKLLKMSDYRPISLCNASYKIISKILTKHFKRFLSDIISLEQTTFVPGRHITDNALVGHEFIHVLKVRKRQSTSYMAIKTDISKAYNRVE